MVGDRARPVDWKAIAFTHRFCGRAEKTNELMIDRELKMTELKAEIKALRERANG